MAPLCTGCYKCLSTELEMNFPILEENHEFKSCSVSLLQKISEYASQVVVEQRALSQPLEQ